MPGFAYAPFNDFTAIESMVNEKTAAIMLEPIQAEGGVHVADRNYLKSLRELCTQQDILLIFDEIQTGMGRTGTFFAYEQLGVKPDIMTLAKGSCRRGADRGVPGERIGGRCVYPRRSCLDVRWKPLGLCRGAGCLPGAA